MTSTGIGTTDEQLLEQLDSGQTEALDELYRRYAAKLYLFCARVTSTSQAEDVVQDVFMRVIEASGQFDPATAPFRAWIFQIAHNRCIDLLRREQRRPATGRRLKADSRRSTLATAYGSCLTQV